MYCIAFVECMFKRYSLRKSAEIVGVTLVTLFYWRHKRPISYTLKRDNGVLMNVNLVRGISHGQVCVLVARDRTKTTVSIVACMGRIECILPLRKYVYLHKFLKSHWSERYIYFLTFPSLFRIILKKDRNHWNNYFNCSIWLNNFRSNI